MHSDFFDGLVVWQKLPNDEPIIVNGEEGIPYYAPNGLSKLAIFSNERLIDSIPIENWKVNLSGRKQNYYSYGDETTGAAVRPIDRRFCRKAMTVRHRMRSLGWDDESVQYEMAASTNEILSSKISSDELKEMVSQRVLFKYQYDIETYSLAAYEYYSNLKERVRLKADLKNGGDSGVIKLALFIALINPCLGERWRGDYKQQGVRPSFAKKSEAQKVLVWLRNRLDELNFYASDSNVFKELYEDETYSLKKTISLIEKEIKTEEAVKYLQVHAVQAVKAKLLSMGIACRKNENDQPWCNFVARAWGVESAQIVSVAKKLKVIEQKREQK